MSKELTLLEISKQLKDFVLEFVKNGLDRRFIHGSFDIIETALKALKIIKEKKVNVDWLLETENVEEYNESLYVNLTQEEYELSKEILL